MLCGLNALSGHFELMGHMNASPDEVYTLIVQVQKLEYLVQAHLSALGSILAEVAQTKLAINVVQNHLSTSYLGTVTPEV